MLSLLSFDCPQPLNSERWTLCALLVVHMWLGYHMPHNARTCKVAQVAHKMFMGKPCSCTLGVQWASPAAV